MSDHFETLCINRLTSGQNLPDISLKLQQFLDYSFCSYPTDYVHLPSNASTLNIKNSITMTILGNTKLIMSHKYADVQ